MTRHALARENTTRILRHADGTRRVVRHRVTVGSTVGTEVVAFNRTGKTFTDEAGAAETLKRLYEGGIPNVVLSMGAEGALLVCREGVFRGRPPKITPKNTVGCGDAMLAGFAAAFARRLPAAEAFQMALAVSASSALSLLTGDFDPADYERLYPLVSVEQQA